MAAKRQTAANNKFLEITKQYAKSGYSILVKYMNEASDDDYDGVFTPMETIVRCAVRNTHPERRHFLIAALKEQGYAIPMDVDSTPAAIEVKEETVNEIPQNEIPQNVIEALAEARETGAYNMLDRRGVIEVVDMFDEGAGEWLTENKARYMDALNAMGEYISKPKPPAPQPAATQDKRADNGESAKVARGEYAVGDYVMFGTADGDMAGGVITSIVDGEFTIDEGNGVTYMRRHYHINRKIDRTPKVSPFNVGDTVRYIGTSKKLTGLTGEVVSVDGTSSHVRFGHRPRSFNLGNSLLELVARATSEHSTQAEAGTGDLSHAVVDAKADEKGLFEHMTDLIVDQYDVNYRAVKANKELTKVAELLDAKDATIARLEAERDSLRAALEEIGSKTAAELRIWQTACATRDIAIRAINRLMEGKTIDN